MTKVIPLILVVLALLLAACGSNKATIETAAPSTAPVNATAEPPTTTSRPTATAQPATATPKLGTRENPVAIGTIVAFTDGWKIKVVSAQPNANAAVAAENQFNKPPDSGAQFFIATVEATYTADGSKSFDASFALRAVGPSAVGYSTFENSCGVIPDKLPSSEVFTGGTVQGSVCWEVKSEDAGALVMYYEPLTLRSTDRVYFDVTP